MIIKTKEDFRDKFIKIPKNISEKKFDKIKAKFEKLGVKTYLLTFSMLQDDCFYIRYIYDGIKIYCVCNGISTSNKKQISIKDFLREEENYGLIAEEIYNCIPNNYLAFYGTDLREIKEDVERAIQGFSYGKPKKFDNVFEGLTWCFKNPMKEIQVYNNIYKQTYLVRYNNKKEVIEWFGDMANRLGTHSLGVKWRELREIQYIYQWKNIREYRPTKITLGEAVKKGLRFKFKGETWRKSPQGFILDSKGNSLKSSTLLDNVDTKVEIIEKQQCL